MISRPVLLAQKQLRFDLDNATFSTPYDLGIHVAGSVYQRPVHVHYSCSSSVWRSCGAAKDTRDRVIGDRRHSARIYTSKYSDGHRIPTSMDLVSLIRPCICPWKLTLS
jgi:hypothetical protein